MRETHAGQESGGDLLACQALLYASGELDEREAGPPTAPNRARAVVQEPERAIELAHQPKVGASADVASAWAKLPKNEQFGKAEERLRLARRDDPRSRLPGNAAPKQ